MKYLIFAITILLLSLFLMWRSIPAHAAVTLPGPVCDNGLHVHNPHCSPSPTPHPTHTPRPTPSDCDHDGDPGDPSDVAGKECPTSSPTPTASPSVSPEPTVTPEATVEPTPAPSQELSQAGAPGCGDSSTTLLPGNALVWRKGDQAIVQWIPTEGSQVNIYYKQVGSSIWQYSVNNIPNNGYYMISGLGTMDITFAVEQINGCGGGLIDPANTIVDNASINGWTLFTP